MIYLPDLWISYHPIEKGQRGVIVAPPKAGKTTLLKKIAQKHIHKSPRN